jgi:two-component system, OmpR family, response regulator
VTRTLLVIEDEELIREIAVAALETIGGMTALAVASGEDGLRTAAFARPDGILLDVMMPGLDGPATLRALRAEPATAGIPVAFLTARSEDGEADALVALGAAAVIAKPFDPMTLAATVRSVFGWA